MWLYVSVIQATIQAATIGQAPVVMSGAAKEHARIGTAITDEPADSVLTESTGIGNLAMYYVSNDLQGCSPQPYDPGIPGKKGAGEFPSGSKEFYVYSAGFWFGALLADDEPSVSKTSYRSDLGAMSVPEMAGAGPMGDISGRGIYKSTMRIPEGLEGAGDYLFVQYGEEPKPYQISWPFTDLSMNKYFATEYDSMEAGDIFSGEDSYAVGGDWIPEEEAVTRWVLPTGAYDGTSLGIRVEQRTYSWNEAYLKNLIMLNYKIRNMNSFTLRAPYFGFFMDPDIGSGGTRPGDQGCWDDIVRCDKARSLVYAYDSDGYEPGWQNYPGYIGVTLLETPQDLGLTGFITTENSADDPYRTDELKYSNMCSKAFSGIEYPSDTRMLLNSGPFADMEPGDEYSFTLAIVVGTGRDEMVETVDEIRTYFNSGISEADEAAPSPLPLVEVVTPVSEGGRAKIRYTLPSSGMIELSLYDNTGRRVETLVSGQSQPGAHEIDWNASNIPSGVYFLRLTSATTSAKAKMVIVK